MVLRLVVNHGYKEYTGTSTHVLLVASFKPSYQIFRIGRAAFFVDNTDRVWYRPFTNVS
jgi:hypothetical protein